MKVKEQTTQALGWTIRYLMGGSWALAKKRAKLLNK